MSIRARGGGGDSNTPAGGGFNPNPPPGGGGGSGGGGGTGSSFFPIGNWFQSPNNAAGYAALGLNTYIGPDDASTAAFNTLKANNMKAYVWDHDQTAALSYSDQTVISGWLFSPDEPDNCDLSPCPWGNGGSENCCCYQTSAVSSSCLTTKNNDSQRRPVMVNVGRAFGNPSNPDRGSLCSSAPHGLADYAGYFANSLAPSNDVYPVNNNGNVMTYVSDAVDRMFQFAPANCTPFQIMEATKIAVGNGTPTPTQTRLETWLALIHQARGITYFCHDFTQPAGSQSAALLTVAAYAAMRTQITTTNAQIKALASVLNTYNVTGVSSCNNGTIHYCIRDFGGHRYLLSCNPSSSSLGTVQFTVTGSGSGTVAVLNESRTVNRSSDVFSDTFAGYDVHLYQVT